MKKNDVLFIIVSILVLLPFFISSEVFHFYNDFNHTHPLIMSFIKFAVLATAGESIGLRIKTGKYNYKGFGIIPRAIVWGFLGIAIKLAFVIFYTGTPVFLEKTVGISHAIDAMKGDITAYKILVAFCISTAMNLIFAPVMMTLHKITDTHILNHNGTLKGFFTPIKFGEIITNLNWEVQYNFVFKKTIPLFWIPAHTITFLLPTDMQVLFAAVLGVMLGVILALAGQKSKA